MLGSRYKLIISISAPDWQGLKQPYQEELTPSMKAIRAGCHHDIRLDDGSEHGMAEAAAS